MLRRILLFWVFWLALVPAGLGAAELRASKAEVRKDVITVIEAQLAAFRADDTAQAYGLASATLRAQFPQRRFASIIQSNYPEIWTSTEAEYGIVRDDGTRARLLVHVKSEQGQASFDYVLVKERNGWRIGSVVRDPGRRKDDV